jgi:hypothetical protein
MNALSFMSVIPESLLQFRSLMRFSQLKVGFSCSGIWAR